MRNILTGNAFGSIAVIDSRSKSVARTLSADAGIAGLEFFSDESFALSLARSLVVWDLEVGRRVSTHQFGSKPSSMLLLEDQRSVVVCGKSGLSWVDLRSLDFEISVQNIFSASVKLDEKFGLFASLENIQVWDFSERRIVHQFDLPYKTRISAIYAEKDQNSVWVHASDQYSLFSFKWDDKKMHLFESSGDIPNLDFSCLL